MTDLSSLLPPPAEWARRMDPARDIMEALHDPVWRLANIYTIYDKKRKQFRPFVPKPEQQIIIWDLFVRGVKNLIIPKARQIGFSTLLAIVALDIVLWQAGAKAALVDKTKDDGMNKMTDIVRVAWDRLPEDLRATFGKAILNQTEFAARVEGVPEDGWSRFRVHKSGRGDALVFLWVSEWGTIQFEEPKRSLEIRTGGMAAAEGGIRVIETTWKGGEGGDVWPYIEMALSVPDDQKDPEIDWFIRFFPWYVEPSYSLTTTGHIRPSIAAYLDEKEKEISAGLGRSFTFTAGQRAWYDRREQEFGLFVKREYPTTLEECWEAPVEGAIYADLYAQALADGRVFPNAYVAGVPVWTLWDLGSPENTVVWYFQIVGGRVRFVDCDMKLWMTTAERVAHMKAKGYTFATHFLPHDANQMKTSVLTFRGELITAGLEGTQVVPVTPDIELGINRTRMLFPGFEFDSLKCADGAKCIKAYHRHHERHTPVPDHNEHACLVAGTIVEMENGKLPIEKVRKGDRVAVGGNLARVINAGMVGIKKVVEVTLYGGEKLRCTEDHLIFTGRGLVEAGRLKTGDQIITSSWLKTLKMKWEPSVGLRDGFQSLHLGDPSNTLCMSSKGSATALRHQDTTWTHQGPIFTGLSGRIITARYRPDFMSTTGIMTALTTIFQTLNFCQLPNMQNCMGWNQTGPSHRQINTILPSSVAKLRSGTNPPPAAIGIKNTGNGVGKSAGPNNKPRKHAKSAELLTPPIFQTAREPVPRSATPSVKTVKRLNESVPVYDLTIEHDHCFVANGMVVSNCDALKVLAEAEGNGMIALNLNTTMPNEHLRFFDPDGLATLRGQVTTHQSQVIHGTLDNATFLRTDPDEAWLRLYEPPVFGRRYHITLVRHKHEREGDVVACWREDGPGLRLVASLAEDLTADVPVLARWVSALSVHYGGATVVPVVDDTSGLLEALVAEGCPALFAREQAREARRVGQGKRVRKRGYELTEQARDQSIMLLQDAIREETLFAPCEELVEQCANFIQATPDQPPKAAPGHGETWVLATGIAFHTRAAGVVLQPVRQESGYGRGRIGGAVIAPAGFAGDADS